MSTTKSSREYDAVVIGAGFSGICATHALANTLGLSVLGIEKGGNVGGTWYWNRYPGVQADTDSFVYRYSFDREVSPKWDMNSRYQNGDQLLDYLQTVALRNGVLDRYRLSTTVDKAIYSEEPRHWTVVTSEGEAFTTRYLIGAAGVLSRPSYPKIDGIERYQGIVVHTAAWPPELKLDGLRVGVIGTGASGSQVIAATAQVAKHVTVFQRSPQYCVPAGQARHSRESVEFYLSSFDELWSQWRESRLACGFEEPSVGALEVSDDERRLVFQRAWDQGGGFGFMFGTFGDIAFNPAANAAAADFIAGKISEIVRDSETASRLTPDEPYAKRPVSVDGYYEAFNLPNVELVCLRETPIARASERGLVGSDDVERELDVLVCATGFEAVDGAYKEIEIIGRGGRNLRAEWGGSPSADLGLATPGFPNFFTILGPQGIFSNLPPGIETQVDFVRDVIAWAERSGVPAVETSGDARASWASICEEIGNDTLFAGVRSWIFGSNVHRDSPRVLFYFGGLQQYREILDDEREAGFPRFVGRQEY